MQLNELLKYNDIIIQCHNFPDADAIAAGYGVYRYLCLNGKNPRLVYAGPGKINKPNMLLMVEKLEIPVEYIQELDCVPELLITVDCVYGESNVQKLPAKNIAVIDHHIYNRSDGLPEMREIRSNYGSCASIIAKMLEDEGIDVNSEPKLSTALYYGLFMDTNGFSEIGHPADRDLRDFVTFDDELINLFRNSNLTHDEMKIAGEALNHCTYIEEYGAAIVRARPCDPNILGFIGDLLIQVSTIDHCIIYCSLNTGFKMSVRSCTGKINASEFAQFLAENVGGGGGHSSKAGGFISSPEITEESVADFFYSKLQAYHKNTDIIYSGSSEMDISDTERYEKRKVILGYVPSTDIVSEGNKIYIRMLEGDMNVIASGDTYLMIGVSGEVYPISRNVFNSTYSRTETLPDTDYEYSPTALDKAENKLKVLIPYINGCYANNSTTVRAKKLTKYVKVFTEWDKKNYISGKPGDYIVIKNEDHKDVYVVKASQFDKLYEKID